MKLLGRSRLQEGMVAGWDPGELIMRRGASRASLLRPLRSTPVDERDPSNDALGIVLTFRCLTLCPWRPRAVAR
jgi:hypothetical protein